MAGDVVAFVIGSGIFRAVCLEAQARGHLNCKICGGIFAPGEMTTWLESAPGGTPRTRGRCQLCEKGHTALRVKLRPVLEQRKLEQGGKCFYCQRPGLVLGLEHRIPVSRGGSHDPENIVAACGSCNSSKGTKTEAEFCL
jgi:5-methylcytosine-specific restriction endonuclease McrA